LTSIEGQVFAAVAMGFRKIEIGLSESPADMEALDDAREETGIEVRSLVIGCRDAQNGATHLVRLAATASDERERAMNCVRRHARLARAWQCRTVILRGCRIEDQRLAKRGAELDQRVAREGATDVLRAELVEHAAKVGKGAQRQAEQLCRTLHHLMSEVQDVRFAIEPGDGACDLLTFEVLGWVLDDLGRKGLGYWHDVGRTHVRQKLGLPGQGDWLEAFGPRTVGAHICDATASEPGMPIGMGEVDFQVVSEGLPRTAERVLEVEPKHGRPEILASVQVLLDRRL
jgi:sugar phosphate isomerase/epimerase